MTFLGHGHHEYSIYGGDGEYFQLTHLWMIERQRWIRGPDLPSTFYSKAW